MGNLWWTFPAVMGMAQSFPPLPQGVKTPSSRSEKSKSGKEKTPLEWSNNWNNFFPAAPVCFFIFSKAAPPMRRLFDGRGREGKGSFDGWVQDCQVLLRWPVRGAMEVSICHPWSAQNSILCSWLGHPLCWGCCCAPSGPGEAPKPGCRQRES